MANRIMQRPSGLEAAAELSSLVCDTAKSFVAFLNYWCSALMVRYIPMDGETTEVEDVRVEYLPALFDLAAYVAKTDYFQQAPTTPLKT
jgi:hypothetical protein